MKNRLINQVFIVLGAVWLIMGLIVYQNSAVWPLGFIFLLIGFIGRYGHKPKP